MALRTPVHPLWGLPEIVLLCALFFTGIWLVAPFVEMSPVAVVAYWLWVAAGGATVVWLSPIILHRDPPERRGWGLPGSPRSDPGAPKQAWKVYAVFTLAGAVVLVAVAALFNPRFPEGVHWDALAFKLAIYTVLGPVQALAFFGYLQTRVRKMVEAQLPGVRVFEQRSIIAGATASVFALFHLPNTPLMTLTFATGLVWSWIFYARSNVFLLGASHAVLGSILQNVVMMHTRIGPFYTHPEKHAFVSAIPGLRDLVSGFY